MRLTTIAGHAIQTDDGTTHALAILAREHATGHVRTISGNDLATLDVFDWLCSLPHAITLSYGLSYDINLWLKDVPTRQLEQLWTHGKTTFDGYRIRWFPGRSFTLTDGPHGWQRTITIWDIYGFFQAPLTDALRAWRIDAPIEDIAALKFVLDRTNDAPLDIDFSRGIVLSECKAVAELAVRLFDSAHRAGIRMRRYDGAGAIAATFLERHAVKTSMITPPDDVQRVSLSAYYGGRVEVSMVGEIGDVHTYDIRSAYPAETAMLPCLAHGIWIRTGTQTEALIQRNPTAVVVAHCTWNTLGPWPPFPWRRAAGGILFPHNGAGWHWRSEIDAARRLFGHDAIRIDDGYWFDRTCDHKPFDFIRDVYRQRKTLEDTGDAAGHVLKIGLAAISGKLAQSQHGTRIPPYQCFTLAGQITAGTRTRVLDAISADPDAVVSVSTDGLASLRSLNLPESDELGGWKHGMLHDLFLVAPGIYTATLRDGTPYTRTRGFPWYELDFNRLREHWQKHKAVPYTWKASRFYGVGSARVLGWQTWRTWRTMQRELGFFPSSRFPRFSARDDILECVPPRTNTIMESAAYDPTTANAWLHDGRNDTALDMIGMLDDGRL